MNAPKPSQTTSPSSQPNIGIIDDDPIAATVMRARLKIQFPNCQIRIYDQPVVDPQLDVYFVDNDFNGSALATELLGEIRALNPNALVIAMSATLGNETLQKLMNGGCNAVYDKNQPSNGEPVFEVIGNYLEVLNRLKNSPTRSPFSGVVTSLRDLLHEWNQRLRHAGF